MDKNQFINLRCPEDIDAHVYRIMREQHVLSLFDSRRNALSRFGNWKDKFENFLMNCGHEFDGVKYDNVLINNMVAQCWTSNKYSDAMWGIYANNPQERFLRIRSTPRRLLRSCDSIKVTFARPRVGAVLYRSTEYIKKYYDRVKSEDVKTDRLFDSLLLKRSAFSHEREIRLIYCAMYESLDGNGLFWYDVDPHDMVTQIMADPNRNKSNWISDEKRIRDKTKFVGDIKRSRIYDAPNW